MAQRDDLRDVIHRRLDAMNRHDLAGLAELYADHCIVDSPSGGGTLKGRRAIEEIDGAWAAAFRDSRFVTELVLVDGVRAAWIGRAEGTATGAFVGLPATGRPFAVPMALVSTFRADRIVHERRIYDFTGMLVQLGLLRTRPGAPVPQYGNVGGMPPSAGGGDLPPARETVAGMLTRRREAWANRDIAGIAMQHAADCVMDSHLAGRIEGPEEIGRVYRAWFESFPDSNLAADGDAIVEVNRVVECATMTGTDTGGFLGFPATGKPFRLPAVWLYTIAGGEFEYVRPIYDFTGMLVQIGVLKAKPV